MSEEPLVLDPGVIREAAARALGEDVGPADVTSLAVVPKTHSASAVVFAKQEGVLAGIPVAEEVFRLAGRMTRSKRFMEDGDKTHVGAEVLRIEGTTRALLAAERSALNFLQQLSGVATLTRRYVDAIAGSKTRILDTRKTVPGLRALQKYAVRCGGGVNHRMGLYDAFMIKDNHVKILGGNERFVEAVEAARVLDHEIPLIFEADTVDQVRALVTLKPDRILLDNMSLEELREAVAIAKGVCELEASGNITLERVRAVAATGVDYISVGALTHSAPALDFSMELNL
jgi:nicotinate-nucleotide pyrophosphorylase (carboxylating)